MFAFFLTFNFVLISFKQWKIINTLNKLLFFVLYFFRLISFKLLKIINTSKSYFSLYDIFFRFIYFKLWKIINILNKIHFFLLIFFPNSVKTKQIKLQCQLLHSDLLEFLFLSVYSWSILIFLYMYIKVIEQSSQIKPVYLLDVIERPVNIEILSFILIQ